MSYRKIGGLHFIRVWRFGFSFYLVRSKPLPHTCNLQVVTQNLEK